MYTFRHEALRQCDPHTTFPPGGPEPEFDSQPVFAELTHDYNEL